MVFAEVVLWDDVNSKAVPFLGLEPNCNVDVRAENNQPVADFKEAFVFIPSGAQTQR